jgi:hypothetical protein
VSAFLESERQVFSFSPAVVPIGLRFWQQKGWQDASESGRFQGDWTRRWRNGDGPEAAIAIDL